MAFITSANSKLTGSIFLPPSKSQTMRAILFASMANGVSKINNYLPSLDTDCMINACKELGVNFEKDRTELIIEGFSGQPKQPENIINCGNSGLVLRFITAVACLQGKPFVVTGDSSIRNNRPMDDLLNGLSQLGATNKFLVKFGYAPFLVEKQINAGFCILNGQDSQPVSAVIIAATQLPGTTKIKLLEAGELPWIKLTLSWLDMLGLNYKVHDNLNYSISGRQIIKPFNYFVPGDLSTLAFPLIAAIITKSNIKIKNVNLQEEQGDKEILNIIEKMQIKFFYDFINNELEVIPCDEFYGGKFDLNKCIDALPALSVLACFAKSKTTFTNIANARNKECNRIEVMAFNLSNMGVKVEFGFDYLTIYPRELFACDWQSHNDHRVAMAGAIAGFKAVGNTKVNDADCIKKTFPDFISAMRSLGANLERNE